MNNDTTEIRALPDDLKESMALMDAFVNRHNFNLKTAIMKRQGIFYQYFANYDKTIKCPQKKPTKPGKEKAAKCFHESRAFCLQLTGMEIVAMKMFNKKHGEFVNFSYESCPIDVVEYLIKERN